MSTPSAQIVAHTPGPWRVTEEISRFSGGEVIRPNKGDGVDSPVAFVADFNRYDRDEERQANARLIAAAPDLLEVVKMLHGVLEHEPRTYGGDLYKTSASRELVLEVLAKAEGRDS